MAAQPELGIRPEWRPGNGSRNRVGSCPARAYLDPRVGACEEVPVPRKSVLVRCPGHNIITSDPSDNHETESVCVANNAGATK